MICQSCKEARHDRCPSMAAKDPSKPGMGLNPAGEAVQLSGLCPCQHRMPKQSVVLVDGYATKSINEGVVIE